MGEFEIFKQSLAGNDSQTLKDLTEKIEEKIKNLEKIIKTLEYELIKQRDPKNINPKNNDSQIKILNDRIEQLQQTIEEQVNQIMEQDDLIKKERDESKNQ